MKTLKIFLTLCALSISSSLFAQDTKVVLNLIADNTDIKDVTLTIIEYREISESRWTLHAKIPAFTPTIVIKGLREGKQYQFRVILASKYGEGRPADSKFYEIMSPLWELSISIWCYPPILAYAWTPTSKANMNYSNINGILNKKTTKVPLRPKE